MKVEIMKIGVLGYDAVDDYWYLKETNGFWTKVYFPFDKQKWYDEYYDGRPATIVRCFDDGQWYIMTVDNS